MEEKIRELKNRTEKLQWEMFKNKEISKLISHMFNTTKVLFEESHNLKDSF